MCNRFYPVIILAPLKKNPKKKYYCDAPVPILPVCHIRPPWLSNKKKERKTFVVVPKMNNKKKKSLKPPKEGVGFGSGRPKKLRIRIR